MKDIKGGKMADMSKVLKKYEGLAQSFEVTTAEMEQDLKQKVVEIKSAYNETKLCNNDGIVRDMASNVNNLSNDFSIMRETLLENIKSSQIILSSFSDEIVANGSDTNPKLLSAYSELLESCNNSIKLLGGIYKDISETHLKIKKLLATEKDEDALLAMPEFIDWQSRIVDYVYKGCVGGIKHVLSHRVLHATFYDLEVQGELPCPDGYVCVPFTELDHYALPRLIDKYLKKQKSLY